MASTSWTLPRRQSTVGLSRRAMRSVLRLASRIFAPESRRQRAVLTWPWRSNPTSNWCLRRSANMRNWASHVVGLVRCVFQWSVSAKMTSLTSLDRSMTGANRSWTAHVMWASGRDRRSPERAHAAMMQSPMALKRTTRIFGFKGVLACGRSAIGRASTATVRGFWRFLLLATG